MNDEGFYRWSVVFFPETAYSQRRGEAHEQGTAGRLYRGATQRTEHDTKGPGGVSPCDRQGCQQVGAGIDTNS